MNTMTGDVTELLQQLIRNECVNDGTAESGHEIRSVDTLQSYFEGSGVDLQRFEPLPGRGSLVARLEGSDPSAPTLMLMGHIDVVPVNPESWHEDPFGGKLKNGVVWGRGAVDMLNLTASMAVATKRLAQSGRKMRGSLVYLGVADEEALGIHGAKWLLDNEPDAVKTDYVVTESGGFRMPLPTSSGPKLPIMVGEKGTYWCRIRVRGTPGHGSMPFRTDNALLKAAEVVRRIGEYQAETNVHEVWNKFLDEADIHSEMTAMLREPANIRAFCESTDDLGIARMIHAATHTTFAPTVIRGGIKTNVIPDTVELDVDIRTLPDQSAEDIRSMIDEALGDLADQVEIEASSNDLASASPTDTPLYESLSRVTSNLVPGSKMIPFLVVGATDARFFRRAGVPSYGYGLFSERISFAEFASMFHGDNERVDVESLELTTQLWNAVIEDFLL
jgi:acetylornithine deacetylase/succinyl-diaminopimelate desuccinylase-like protein